MSQKFYKNSGTLERTNTFEYDNGAFALGQLTRESNAAYSRSYTYGSLGKQLSETTSLSGTEYVNSFEYAPTGELTRTTYPDQFAVQYDYQK